MDYLSRSIVYEKKFAILFCYFVRIFFYHVFLSHPRLLLLALYRPFLCLFQVPKGMIPVNLLDLL